MCSYQMIVRYLFIFFVLSLMNLKCSAQILNLDEGKVYILNIIYSGRVCIDKTKSISNIIQIGKSNLYTVGLYT